ncbi:hypothetical protein [Psychrobacillus sp. FSL K6-2843]|uniref:hypothetical protein n=1 Tax=Psychrobacillus sp. FSL K6-2843 TaxID=2921549 RepID=UPI00315A3803
MRYRKRRRINYSSGKAFLKLISFIFCLIAFLPTSLLYTNVHNDSEWNDFNLGTFNNIFQNSFDQLLVVSYEIDSNQIDEDEQLPYIILNTYTVFGIPYAEVIVTSEGAYINKKYLFKKE